MGTNFYMLHKSDYILSTLINAANKSTLKIGKHAAAVITKDGDIVSIGVSHHTIHTTFKHTIHAEQDAILKFNYKYKYTQSNAKYSLIVVRVINNTVITNSEPCSECVSMLKISGIKLKKVYYTTRIDDVVELKCCSLQVLNNNHQSSGTRYYKSSNRV